MQHFLVEAATVETKVYGDCLGVLLARLAPLRNIQVCRFEVFGKSLKCIFSIPDLNSLTERTMDENAATTDNPEDVHDAKGSKSVRGSLPSLYVADRGGK